MGLTPLRVGIPYRRMWLGTSLSRIGTALTNVVVGLQVYDVTGWTAAVGVVGLFAVIPLVAPRDALFAVNSPARALIVPCLVAMVGSLSPGPTPADAPPTPSVRSQPEPLRLRGRPGHGTVGRVIGTRPVRNPDRVDVHRTFTPGVEHR